MLGHFLMLNPFHTLIQQCTTICQTARGTIKMFFHSQGHFLVTQQWKWDSLLIVNFSTDTPNSGLCLSTKRPPPWPLCNQPYNGDQEPFSDHDHMPVHIVDNKIYSSQVLRINFTTYNIHRDQDTVNLHTHSDIIVLSDEDDPNAHPYWYTCVLRVFHLKTLHLDPSAMNHSVQHMDVLWVWWFGLVPGYQFEPKAAQLLKIRFIPETDLLPFGFLNLSLVIHAAHLIPAFNKGCTTQLLTASWTAGQPPGETDNWAAFFVSMYVFQSV